MVTAARNGSTNEGPFRLWDLATRHATVLASNFWIRPSIVCAPDSQLLAFATFNHGVRLWSLFPLQEITNLLSDFSLTGPQGLAFSPDGQTLAYTRNQAGEIGLWDLRSQRSKPPLAGHR